MRVAIAAYHQLKFGEHWDKSCDDLVIEVCNGLQKNSSIKPEDIDSAFIGSYLDSIKASNLVYDEFGIKGIPIYSDIAGSLAIMQAFYSIVSGKAKIAMVVGVEKTSDFLSEKLAKLKLSLVGDDVFNGLTLDAGYALITKKYMQEFKLTREKLASVSVKNHKNALNNEFAFLRKKINNEQVINSPLVADPLRVMDTAPLCDGAAAILLCGEDIVESYCKDPVFIINSAIGHDKSKLSDRGNLTTIKATSKAIKSALSTKITEISLAEVHDIFSISEIIAVEDLGLCEKGQGADFIKDNKNRINPSGGLKACGHAIGATGVRQTIDVVKRLKNGLGLSHSISGFGSSCIINLFSKS